MGILGALFGGSKQKSSNQAFGAVSKALSPAMQIGGSAINSLNSELAGGFDGFRDKAGFDFQLDQGMRGITGGAAARGMLRSGGTGKALARFGNDLKSSMYMNYLNSIGQLGQLGLGAAGTIVGAGGESRGSSNGGIIPGLFG